MTDPMDALFTPVEPVEPDPAFEARLRERLRRALSPTPGGTMTDMRDTDATVAAAADHQPSAADLEWPPALTPYIAVADARRALDWYVEVFGAERRGDPVVMPDGSIGHAELGIGDGVLMLAEGTGDVPVRPPEGDTFSHTIFAQVDDVDGTVERARRADAAIEREPVDEPYGRVAVIVDPFGHRWMLDQPPARFTRQRHGDVAYITMGTADDARAKEFYGAVLGWRFAPGSVERGWQVEDVQPMMGLWGDPSGAAEVQLCYRVGDIEAAAERVRQHGGQAGDVTRRPYGLMVDCVDNQGATFQLWQPVD